MTKFGLLFLAIFVSGIVAAFKSSPVWAYYLYELVYFLNPGNRWWGNSLPDIKYSFIVTFVLLLLTFLNRNKHLNSLNEIPELKWFIGLIIAYIVITPFAVNDAFHMRFFGYLMTTWVVFFSSLFLMDELKKVEWAMFFFMIGAAYIGYEAYVVGRNEFGRIDDIGTLDAPEANTIAASIVPSLVFCAYFLWHGNFKVKIVALFCGALIANGLILINSRGAFLAASLSIIYFGFFMMFAKYKLPKQKRVLIFFVVAGIVGIIHIADATFWERMATLATQSSIDSEGSGGRRMNFWLATFAMLKDYPMGFGIYGYETLSTNYLREEWITSEFGGRARSVHSIWFQALGEIGWFGLIMFLTLLMSLKLHMNKAKKALKENNFIKDYYMLITIESAIAAFLIASTFLNMFRASALYILISIGICAAVTSLRLVSKNNKDQIEKAIDIK